MPGRRNRNGRISTEEAAQRRCIVQRVQAHGRIEGIRRSPASDEVFEAYERGEISVTEIVPRLRASPPPAGGRQTLGFDPPRWRAGPALNRLPLTRCKNG